MARLQFRVLYRQFLFRMVDLELLSRAAQGDINGLLGKFAALLLFLSLWLGAIAFGVGNLPLPPAVRLIAVWAMEHFLIATTMLVVGLFAVISWDSMFPDRRDVLVLSPLPIRARTLFLSKAAAVATALCLAVGILNALSSLASPFGFAAASGGLGMLRLFGVYWVTMLSAGAFNIGLVLSIQGLAQLLPRQQFLRVSATLQIAAFFLFVSMYFLQLPFASPSDLLSIQNQRLLGWLPSYWFFGLFQQLNGTMPEALALLARRAWIGLAASLGGAAAAYLICYFRTLRKIAEQADILPGSAGLRWLPPFGGLLETAIAQFSIRTLFRSRRHRVTLSFYMGLAFAFVLFITKAPVLQTMAPAGDPWHQVNPQMMVASILVMCSAVVGMRVAFAMPIDLRANWIFRVTPIRGGQDCRNSVRRSLFALGVAPAWVASAAVFFWLWPWRPAAGHLTILGLIGIILAEVCLQSFRKIPFTCSFLPGKTHYHIAIMAYVALVVLLGEGAEIEQSALVESGLRLATLLTVLGVVAALLRWRTDSLEEGIEFEDIPAPAVMVLGLTRDGTSPVS
jgi:hypothetical protein